MLFKAPRLATEYPTLHPELRRVLAELEKQLAAWGLPSLTITEALRTPDDQERLYWKRELKPGVTEEHARALARARPSWHLHHCAADFRNSVYGPRDRRRIHYWLTQRCPSDEWEVLMHDIGRGDHFHVARKDESWRKARVA